MVERASQHGALVFFVSMGVATFCLGKVTPLDMETLLAITAGFLVAVAIFGLIAFSSRTE